MHKPMPIKSEEGVLERFEKEPVPQLEAVQEEKLAQTVAHRPIRNLLDEGEMKLELIDGGYLNK